MNIKKILAAGVAAASVASVMAVAASAETYTAEIAMQSSAYSFRETMTNAKYGKDSGKGVYEDKYIAWGDDGPDTRPGYEDYYDEFGDDEGYLLPATYTAATIDGPGVYKVAAETDFTVDKAGSFNWLIISTDIPYEADDEGVCTSLVVSNVKVTFDGTVVSEDCQHLVAQEDKTANNVQICINNQWGADEIKQYPFGDNYPTAKMEIEFTVDSVGPAPADPEPADPEPADPTPADPEPAPAPVEKPNTGTGAEGIAVAAGVAVLAAGAIVVSKKRK